MHSETRHIQPTLQNTAFRRTTTVLGWCVAVLGSLVYLLTLEPTVSFWDCGEFIATSYKLQIGHPPGAPLYSLLAHCFMLLAGGNTACLAWWSNALSAVAGGAAAMFLFWTLTRLIVASSHESDKAWQCWLPAIVGSSVYLFCDTAWFSAVESEVYSLSMLFSSAIVWASVRWVQDGESASSRWPMLIALLLGMSVGVHMLSLLTLPAVAVAAAARFRRHSAKALAGTVKTIAFSLAFFVVGLSPYVIVPIRASADPPINMGKPSTCKSFSDYISRSQYEHAPLVYGRCFNSPIVDYKNGKPVYAPEMDMLFPRMWKHHDNAETYYTDWVGRHGSMVNVDGKEYYKPSFGDNIVFFGAYQLGYMYLRYLMWNFSGRYDDRQGFGSLQKGQFITGIPFVDRWYVGSSVTPPSSLPRDAHNRYFMIPLVLGIVGAVNIRRRSKPVFWFVMVLFLMGGPVLSVYLNHPLYEPRERDYAYILSFYAYAMFCAFGARRVVSPEARAGRWRKAFYVVGAAVAVSAPVLMATQNWNDHNRSHRFVARDLAQNMLNSCSPNSILFTVGDNDTFPLWYLQQVEGQRTDVQVVNVSLLAADSYAESMQKACATSGMQLFSNDEWRSKGPYGRMNAIIGTADGNRTVFFSRYAYNAYRSHSRFAGRLSLCGMAYRLNPAVGDSVDARQSATLYTTTLSWHALHGVHVSETGHGFLVHYLEGASATAAALVAGGDTASAIAVLDSATANVPLRYVYDMGVKMRIAAAYHGAGQANKAAVIARSLLHEAEEQKDYYQSMTRLVQSYMPNVSQHLDSVCAQTSRLSTTAGCNQGQSTDMIKDK